MDSISPSLFTEQKISAVGAPLKTAKFLPPRVYSDNIIFEMEKEQSFKRTWLPVCHISQIPEKGSYVARQLLDEAIIAIRGYINLCYFTYL